MPRGIVSSQERDPLSFTKEDGNRLKRLNRDTKEKWRARRDLSSCLLIRSQNAEGS